MITDNGNYSLEIISRDQEYQGKNYKEYKIDDGINIGVYENEPFLIRFKNHTGKRVQVRISIDGTDVLTGKLAHTDSTNDGMWVVGAWGSMELKAWPEGNQGGAELLFTHQDDSVAANIHGNMSSKGIIAVAVFEENHEPYSLNQYLYINKTISSNSTSFNKENKRITRRISYDDDFSMSDVDNMAVGAGNYVNQNITKTSGLIKPELSCILKVKYQSWITLRSKIRQQAVKKIEATDGFPGNKEKFINLGSTPRLEIPIKKIKRFRNEIVDVKNRAKKNKRRLSPKEKYVEYQRFI